MKNPCKECIVDPMCEEYCNDLKQYLNDNLVGQFYDRHGMMATIASWYRTGIAELYNNDTQWRIKEKKWNKTARDYVENERWNKPAEGESLK